MGPYFEIKKEFESRADSENAAAMAKYMKDRFNFYGLPAPKRKEVYHSFLKSEKKSKKIDWDLLDKCYEDDHREFQYFVSDYLIAMSKFLTYDDIPRIKTYIKSKQWWDTIDFLAKVIGAIGSRDKRVGHLMIGWSTDEDFWVRRIAIEHQLCRKEFTNTELLEIIIVNNFGSSEFYINKAIGWALRDYSKTDPKWVEEFLEKYKDKMDKLSRKEAGKYI